MAKKKISNVTMRVRVGEKELEVSGPSDFVEEKINDFLKEQKAYPLVTTKTSGEKVMLQTDIDTGKKMAAAQFFRKINPRTDVDRALVAGYYIEKFKRNECFTAAEVREIIRTAKINPPKNTNDSINSNIRKGLMMSAGDKEGTRAFVLTTDGEDAIREAVAQ